MLGLWIAFNVVLVFLIVLDLNYGKGRETSSKKAMLWSAAWVSLALLFNIAIGLCFGKIRALEFLAGYLIELSLSVDNLFVFLIVFKYFDTSSKYQPKILFWGILGALAMRLICILIGISLIQSFHSILYVFGLFLVITGIMMFKKKEKNFSPENNYILKIIKKIIPFQQDDEGGKFFIRKIVAGSVKIFATPLFAVLVTIETLDLLFALDSIPAIFGITLDPFIVYTSNAFAILGLRSLYFALQPLMGLFSYLHHGVCLVLIFVGLKMLLQALIVINIGVSLAVIALILLASILLSLQRSPPTTGVTHAK